MIVSGIIRLQDIGQNTASPHIRVETDRFAFDDFWCGKFCRASANFHHLVGIEFRGQTKIDQFHVGTVARLAHDILRFDICKREFNIRVTFLLT